MILGLKKTTFLLINTLNLLNQMKIQQIKLTCHLQGIIYTIPKFNISKMILIKVIKSINPQLMIKKIIRIKNHNTNFHIINMNKSMTKNKYRAIIKKYMYQKQFNSMKKKISYKNINSIHNMLLLQWIKLT